MNFNSKKSQEKSLHSFFSLSKKIFFERAFRYNFLAVYFLTLTLAYTSGYKKISNEVIQEDAYINNNPVITSAKMITPGVLEIQFKAPVEASILKYEYAVDGAPFWNNVENISSPLPVNGANGTITIPSFAGKSSIRIRAISSNMVYSSEPYFLANSLSEALTASK